MSTDFSKPLVTDGYAELLPGVQGALVDLAKGLDPSSSGTHTNVPTNAMRWLSAGSRWEWFNGTSWNPLPGAYAISISGSAATAVSAENILGGVAGSIPWQSTGGATGFTGVGGVGQALRSGGTGAPTWGTLGLEGGGTGGTSGPEALVSMGERTGASGSLVAPSGTTAQRDVASLVGGLFRYNSQRESFEGYIGTEWGAVGRAYFYDGGAVNAIDVRNGAVQRWAPATGAQTLTITGWPAAGTLGELLIEGVNLGAATISWPTISWVKSDGSFTQAFAGASITLQAAGLDFVCLWTRDGGTTVYGKVVR